MHFVRRDEDDESVKEARFELRLFQEVFFGSSSPHFAGEASKERSLARSGRPSRTAHLLLRGGVLDSLEGRLGESLSTLTFSKKTTDASSFG